MATKTTERKPRTLKKPVRCLVASCTRNAVSRGLCPNHYQSAENAIKSGKTSGWAELEKLGVVLPARPQSNGFAEFLAAKRGKTAPKVKAKAKPKTKPKSFPAPAPVENSSGNS